MKNHRGDKGIDRELRVIAHQRKDFLRGDLAAVINDQQRQEFRQAAKDGGRSMMWLQGHHIIDFDQTVQPVAR